MSEYKHEFRIKILGRLLEHLGVQMYKQRDAAIAELVANAWDAGATTCWITVPDPVSYDQGHSIISVEDNGSGMDIEEMQDKYLVIGRNRRTDEHSDESDGRKVMGRKGIGKLAGFGIATNMTVETWVDARSIELTLNLEELKNDPVTEKAEDMEKKLVGIIRDRKPDGVHDTKSGTCIKLSSLKQKSAISIENLHMSLARRFSRTVRGLMTIIINETELRPVFLSLHANSPGLDEELIEETIAKEALVRYRYSYSANPITADRTLQGWTILVNGKTAQAPPFFFDVDTKGASQHSSKYLIGEIEADFLDQGTSDEGDVISTDRQEIDWEREETWALWEWGRRKTQAIFLEIAERNADHSMNVVLADNGLMERIDRLDAPLKSQCMGFIRSIGKIRTDGDELPPREKILQMADQIIKAFEYRHFVDVIEDIEGASEDPKQMGLLLAHLEKWEVLESRSILEIIKGRIRVLDKFRQMIIIRSPETANRDIGADNFHDLIAGFPWLLNPEWQVYLEEKSITTILRDKAIKDFPEAMARKRVDFLALQGEDTIAVIEIKSVDDVLPLEELRRLEDYKISLAPSYDKKVIAVLIYGGKHSIPSDVFKQYEESDTFRIIEWSDIFSKNLRYYEHYRAVLENHITSPNFFQKEVEVGVSQRLLASGTVHRDREARAAGLLATAVPAETPRDTESPD